MAPTQPLLLISSLTLLLISIIAAATTIDAPKGFRVDLTRVDSSANITKLEHLRRSIKRNEHKISRLAASASSEQVKAPVHTGNGEFLMSLSIGTPKVPFSAIVDTGSDLIWTQCKPYCKRCYDQPTPLFDPSASSSYSNVSCSTPLCDALPVSRCRSAVCEYLYAYGDQSSTQGVLATDTFSFDNGTTAPRVGFGCGEINLGDGFTQAGGLVGLGRGPLSLVSQLGLGRFSYCLTSLDDDSGASPLLLGTLAELGKGGGTTTPLTKNPSKPSFYYLSLKGISVGGTKLDIPETTFAVNSDDGTGGLIIDSGTSITYLEEEGYKAVREAFVAGMKMEVADQTETGLDLCFALSKSEAAAGEVEVPKMVLHFDGGADWELPAENYFVTDLESGVLCLAMMKSSGMSILGNFQQQNMHVVYDMEKETLSFAPAKCSQI